ARSSNEETRNKFLKVIEEDYPRSFIKIAVIYPHYYRGEIFHDDVKDFYTTCFNKVRIIQEAKQEAFERSISEELVLNESIASIEDIRFRIQELFNQDNPSVDQFWGYNVLVNLSENQILFYSDT